MKFVCVFCTMIYFSLSVSYINGHENVLHSMESNARTSIKPVTNDSYQTNGFNSTNVASGPILIIDKKTIFISNLHYRAKGAEYFWVGSGKPSSNGTLVRDQNGSSAGLSSYSGGNVYLRLPEIYTADKIDYLGIWSPKTNTDIGHVLLYDDESQRNYIPEASEFYNKTQDNKVIFRVPKCCELSQFYKENSTNCTARSGMDMKIDYSVFDSNETHIDPIKFMTNIEFIPYYYSLVCKANSVRLLLGEETETYGLIYNSSLIYVDGNSHGIYSHGEFCMENIQGKSETMFYKCEPIPQTVMSKIPDFYFPFLVISTICFFLSTICFQFILKEKDVHRKCIIGYSTWMTVTFICLILFQKLSGMCISCNFLGTVYMFSSISAFVWLTCLCTDLLYVVKSYTKYSEQTRFYCYIGISLVIPLIVITSSLIPDGIPDVPESVIKDYNKRLSGTCLYSGQHSSMYFAPIGILLGISVVCLVGTSYVIKTHNDNDWIDNGRRFKFMLVQTITISIIMIFSYSLDLALSLIDLSERPGGFLFPFILVYYTQGLSIFIILAGNDFAKDYKARRQNQNTNDNHETGPLRRAEWI